MREMNAWTGTVRVWWIFLGAMLVLGACGGEGGPDTVASFRGYGLDHETLRAEFVRVNPQADWASTTVPDRAAFAELLLKKEILLQLAREACPEPDRKRRRLDAVLYEKNLLREYLAARRERFALGPEALATAIERLKRTARVELATVRQADMEAIREEMLAGGNFEDVARKYASEKGPQGRGFTETVVNLQAPRTLVRAVLLEDLPAGTVVGPVATTKGIYFLRIIDFLPLDLASIPGGLEQAKVVAEDGYYQPFNEAYLESLTTASGLRLHEESFPVIKEIMQAFWDSVNAASDAGQMVRFQEFRGPVWRVPAEQANLPVLDLFGKTYGVKEFIGTLDDIDLDYWITVGPLNKVAFQIDTRAQRLLSILEAEKTGVPERPSFRTAMQRLEEQHLLQQFRERYLAEQFPADPAALEAEYRDRPDAYTAPDRFAYGLVIFPRGKEARARQVQAQVAADPTRWFELVTAEAGADTTVLYYPDTGLKTLQDAPPDPSWAPFRDAASALPAQGAVSEVLATQHGFTIVRCNQKDPARRLSFDEAKEDVTRNVRERWLDEEIERRLTAAMKSYGAKVDTVKLEAAKAAEAGAPQS